MPAGLLVGCSVLSGQWAFIHSSFTYTITSSLPFLDYAFVQQCCAFLENFPGTLCMYTPRGRVFSNEIKPMHASLKSLKIHLNMK